MVLALAGLLVSLEGFFREGLHKNANRTLSVCYTRFFTRHEVCVFTPDLSYTLLENPFSVSGGRCDVRVHLPCGLQYRVRGVLPISGAGNPVHAVSGVTVLFRRCAGTAPRFILILERS